MAHLRKRYRRKNGKKVISGYAAVFYNPQRHPSEKYITLRTTDRDIARRKFTELERLESLGEFDPWADSAPRDGVLVVEAVKEFIADRSHLRPTTLRADKSTLTCWAGSFEVENQKKGVLPRGCLLSQLEPRHIQDFLDGPINDNGDRLSPASRQTYYARISAFLSWCRENRLMRHDPIGSVARPRLRKREKQYFTHAQYDRLRRTIKSEAMLIESGAVKQASLKDGEVRWLLDVVEVAVATGMRRSELVNMRWSWVNFDANQILIRNDGDFIPKGKHERAIPFDEGTADVLRRLNGQRTTEADAYVFTGVHGENKLNADYLSKRFKLYVRLSDVSNDLTFHSLRHTFCTWMIQAGVPVPVVQKLAGHADVKTTMQYLHVAGVDKRKAIARVREWRSSESPV